MVCARTGLLVYAGSTVTCCGWIVPGLVCRCMLVGGTVTGGCVRTGLLVYAGSTVNGRCQDWSVSV